MPTDMEEIYEIQELENQYQSKTSLKLGSNISNNKSYQSGSSKGSKQGSSQISTSANPNLQQPIAFNIASSAISRQNGKEPVEMIRSALISKNPKQIPQGFSQGCDVLSIS